jgi:hypothetical protein
MNDETTLMHIYHTGQANNTALLTALTAAAAAHKKECDIR